MAQPESALSVALIGAGRVGTAVSVLLKEAGHRIIGVASRSRASAEAAAERLKTSIFELDAPEPIEASLALIAVPDDAIAEVAERVGPRLSPGTVVCHFAGSLGLEVLAGAGTDRLCALHPVQACPDVESAIARLPGSAWGVTCSPGLEEWATHLIERDLHGIPVIVGEADRALWHAAAVTTANGVTALLAAGEAMLAAMGIERPIDVLGPLAAGTIANARAAGDATAVLTGPAIRGDRDTLRRHLDALAEAAPDLIETYGLAARITLDAVRRSGLVDERARDELEAALRG